MNLLAILLHHDGAASGTGVRSEHHASVVFDADDGGSCFFVGGHLYCFFLLEKGVAEWRGRYR